MRAVPVALALLLAAHAPAPAQDHLHIYMAPSFDVPKAPSSFEDNWRTGRGLTAAIANPVGRYLSITGHASYSRFQGDQLESTLAAAFLNWYLALAGSSASAADIEIAETTHLHGAVGARLGPTQGTTSLRPYLTVTVGVTKISRGDIDVDGKIFERGISETALSIDVLAGTDVRIGERWGVFGEAGYMNVFTADARTAVFSVRTGLLLTLRSRSSNAGI